MTFTSSYTAGLIQQSEYHYGTPDVSLTGSFTGSFTGDGSQLTGISGGGAGIFSDVAGYKQTINNLIISESNASSSLSIINSGSTIFDVQGSVGQLFEVADGLDGVLMSVNDISGIPILTVSSSGDIFLAAGSTLQGTAATASYVPGVSAAFPFTGSAAISGSLNINGSGSGIFDVDGTVGSLFSVNDGLDGILMSVNDISGLPLFEVSSSGDVEINLGNISGSSTSTASFGTYIGDGSGLTNISSPSLNDITLGNSTIVGDGASSAASYGNVFGKSATSTGGQNVVVGAFSNVKTYGVSIGDSVAGGNQTVAIGYNAGHTNGEYNVLIGQQPGNNTSGNYNISLGYLAGFDQTTGTGNITIGSGSRGLAGESNQLRIGHGINGATISASLETGNIILQGDVSSSAASTASFGTYIGDGSQLTGISSGGETPTFIASGSTSASAAPNTGVVVEHSGSTAFSVIGDVGTLFSVDDDLTGTLFSANDISGFPVLQADSTGEVYLGKSPQSLYTTAVISSTTAATTHSLVSLSTSSYDGAFFEYTAISSSNARAGNIMSVWNGANIVSTETTSSQIGNTADLTAEVIISQSQAQLVVYSPNASYKIKTIIKAI